MPVDEKDVALAYGQWRECVQARERDRAKLAASTQTEAASARTFAWVLDEYLRGQKPAERKIRDR
jgi:hypothetical protein